MTKDREGVPVERTPRRAPSLRQFFAYVFRRKDGAPLFVLKTTAMAWVATACVLALINSLYTLPDAQHPVRSIAYELTLALVAIPVIENLLMAGLIEPLDASGIRWQRIVAVVAVASGVAHGLVYGWRWVAGTIEFAAMAYSYLLWKDRGFVRRYALTCAQHALFNLPATLIWLLSN